MPYWTNKVGRPVKISEMTNEYLFNCIRMVERNYDNYLMNVKLNNDLNISLASIDEIPYIEHELSIVEKFPVYSDLTNELKIRKK